MMNKLFAWLMALAAPCLFPTITPAADLPALPPFTPAYEPESVDERGLWMQTDEAERVLQNSPLVVEDEELHAYVQRVLCATVGDDRCKSVRIYIIEMPVFNATMSPNGMMQVYTGLLMRVRSEAELGAVLGHEFAHFELRHSLAGFKNRRNTTDVMAWLSVVGGITNTSVGSVQMSLLGSIFSYDRAQETQADLLSLKYLGNSPYPSASAPQVWAHLMEEEDATHAGRKLKNKHQYSAGFFSSHPTNLARWEYLSRESKTINDDDDPKFTSHRLAISKQLPRWLKSQNKLNDFGGSDYILNALADISGWTPDLLYARGQLYQTRGNPRDLVTAAQFYQQALDAGYTGVDIHRDMGLALLRSGNSSTGLPELRQYLTLAPDAPDVGAIAALVPDFKPSGRTAANSTPSTDAALIQSQSASSEGMPPQ